MATGSLEASPQALRELVLDYLLHNAYIDAARAFASDSSAVVHADEILEGLASDTSSNQPTGVAGTSKQIDEPTLSEEALELVKQRREIKVHILSGRVDEAVQLLNSHFPAVLQEVDCDTPLPRPIPPNPSSPFSRLQYASQVSVKPVHVALNLRIQAFIEAARTTPLIYPPVDSKRPYASIAPNGADYSEDAYSAHQTALLHRAQRLYAEVESLRDTRDRDTFRKELSQVGGLLAYKVPEASTLRRYLSQERREKVADQVNSAILYHMGKPAASHIELYVRQTSTVMSVMRDNNIAASSQMRDLLPADFVTQPAPAPLQPKLVNGANGKPEKTEKADSEKPQACPYFNLDQFLESR